MGKTREEIITDVTPQINAIVNFLGNKTWLTGNELTWLDFVVFETICFLDFLSSG